MTLPARAVAGLARDRRRGAAVSLAVAMLLAAPLPSAAETPVATLADAPLGRIAFASLTPNGPSQLMQGRREPGADPVRARCRR